MSRCPTAAVPLEHAYTSRTAIGDAILDHAVLTNPDMNVQTDGAAVPADRLAGLLVLNPDNAGGLEAVKRTANTTLSMPLVTQPGEEWVTGPTGSIAVLGWVRLFSGAALTIVLLAGTLAATASHLRARPTAPSPDTHRTSVRLARAALTVALPLTLTVLVSVGVIAVLGAILTQIAA